MNRTGKMPSAALMVVLIFFVLLGGWKVLDEDANGSAGYGYGGAAARSALAEIALREYEENGDTDGAGEKYWTYWGKTTESWCVDFLYYCGDQIDLVGTGKPFGTYTAGVGEAWDNMVDAGAMVYAVGEEVPQAGDVVFWYRKNLPPQDVSGNRPPMKHLGIVISYSEEDGILTTIEGNSGTLGSAKNHVAMNTYSNIGGYSATGVSIYGFARISASGVGDLTEMIKTFEGFLPYPVWDYAQYSVGYGTACPEDKREYYTLYGISEEDATALLEQHISIAADSVDSYIASAQLDLAPHQRDALISLTYNIGAGWTTGANYAALRAAIADPTLTEQQIMTVFAQICHAGGEKLPGLIGRRMCEAHLFMTGEYLTNFGDTGYTYEVINDVVVISRRTIE